REARPALSPCRRRTLLHPGRALPLALRRGRVRPGDGRLRLLRRVGRASRRRRRRRARQGVGRHRATHETIRRTTGRGRKRMTDTNRRRLLKGGGLAAAGLLAAPAVVGRAQAAEKVSWTMQVLWD